MSWQAWLLNKWLRLTERPQLARANDTEVLRRSFERKARIFFHAPRGTHVEATRLGAHEALRIVPRQIVPQRLILYFHGGGYVFGSPRTHKAMIAQLGLRAGSEALVPFYPLAPEHPFPAAPDAAREIWQACLDQGWAPDQIIIGGDSAGGGLALSLLAQLCCEGGPVPGGLFGFSPLTDMTYSGASFTTNAAAEVVLPPERSHEMMATVLDGAPADAPRASPLFADFPGAPPVWLCAGDTEILLDDTRRMAAHLRAQGVDVEMQIERDLPHVWPIFHNILPEARTTLGQLADWLRRRWRRPGES